MDHSKTSASLVIGIAGGSGSGKSTVADALATALPPGAVALLRHDHYYRDRPDLSREQRNGVNYDHPEALETALLVEHLQHLKAGNAVEIPIYDFKTHRRGFETTRLEPAPVIIVEGILVFVDEHLRRELDIKIFVDTEPDIRAIRRIRRDMRVRGRDFEAVRRQYYETVRPMHVEFVEPSKRTADLIIPEGGENRVAIDVLLARLYAAVPVESALRGCFSPLGRLGTSPGLGRLRRRAIASLPDLERVVGAERRWLRRTGEQSNRPTTQPTEPGSGSLFAMARVTPNGGLVSLVGVGVCCTHAGARSQPGACSHHTSAR